MSRKIGFYQENRALAFLKDAGMEIIGQNFCSRFGEIDIIGIDEGELAFIEVRYRKNARFGDPFESITQAKQQKIIKTAMIFLNQQPQYEVSPCRFDAVSVEGDKVTWLKAVFTA